MTCTVIPILHKNIDGVKLDTQKETTHWVQIYIMCPSPFEHKHHGSAGPQKQLKGIQSIHLNHDPDSVEAWDGWVG